MDARIKQLFKEEQAAEGARRFGLRLDELRFIGGFQNFIYSFERERKPFILRFTPGTLRTKEAVEGELEWVAALAEAGLSVSGPVRSAQGRYVERIHAEESVDFYATAFAYAPGRKVGYPECLGNAGLYEQCGRDTGRLHAHSKRFVPSVKRHTWERNDYLLRAADYIPNEDAPFLPALAELQERLRELPVSSDTFGLIHGDISVGNFMVDDTGAITLFDFDECQYSWYAEDIAIQLYYQLYVFGEDVKADRTAIYELFVTHFARGYEEDGRRLPSGWKEQLPLFLRLREIIVVVGMYRSLDLTNPDPWTRDFLKDSRERILGGVSLIDHCL